MCTRDSWGRAGAHIWVQFSASSFSSVTDVTLSDLERSLALSVPQFPHLFSEEFRQDGRCWTLQP